MLLRRVQKDHLLVDYTIIVGQVYILSLEEPKIHIIWDTPVLRSFVKRIHHTPCTIIVILTVMKSS